MIYIIELTRASGKLKISQNYEWHHTLLRNLRISWLCEFNKLCFFIQCIVFDGLFRNNIFYFGNAFGKNECYSERLLPHPRILCLRNITHGLGDPAGLSAILPRSYLPE